MTETKSVMTSLAQTSSTAHAPAAPRPLSPHLSIYRFHLSMALSILHRITGVALVGALCVLVLWMWAAAYDTLLFSQITACLHGVIGRIALAAFTVIFYLKFALGLRHLLWDTGRGFALVNVDRTAYAAIVFTIGMSALTWYFILTA